MYEQLLAGIAKHSAPFIAYGFYRS